MFATKYFNKRGITIIYDASCQQATTVYTMVYFFRFAKNVTLTPELLRGLPLISMAALLIATKFKEQPRKIRDIVNVYHIVVGKDSSIKKEQVILYFCGNELYFQCLIYCEIVLFKC